MLDELQTGKTIEDRLEALEIASAHQAKLIEELNAVVTAHTQNIAELQTRLEALSRRSAVTEMQLRDLVPVDKPPHW